jgi:hypothetical protein
MKRLPDCFAWKAVTSTIVFEVAGSKRKAVAKIGIERGMR